MSIQRADCPEADCRDGERISAGLANMPVVTPAEACAVTDVLAAYSTVDPLGDGAPESVMQAKRTLLDTVGVALAARDSDLVRILAATHPGFHDCGGSVIWTTSKRADAETVAMVNGATAHALDFDDVNESVRGHLGSTLWPTIVSLAESLGSSGRAMVEAYLIGVRTGVAIADGMLIDTHYGKGWHSTSTVGVLAATCAAARLLGLDRRQVRNALGIAGSMASGSRQNFGTMTKPLHAGIAARNAVLSARLAKANFSANEAMLEGPVGYYALFESRNRMAEVAASLSRPWAAERHGTSMKRYAVCYNLHRACDATLMIRQRHDIVPSEIRRILITLEPNGTAPLFCGFPRSALECKFSPGYAVGALLLDRKLGPTSFDSRSLDCAELGLVLPKVRVTESPIPPVGPSDWFEGYAVVEIELASGRIVSERVDNPKGHWGNPFSQDELRRKFMQCARTGGVPDARAREAESQILNLDRMPRFEGFAFNER